MQNMKEMELQYCTSCGAVNKKSAVLCEECKKKIVVRHRPIVDFLKKRAKGKATGEITEKLFDLIKDFLFDHLYGVILTVSVVATATTAVVTSTPYIEEVTIPPFEKTVISESTDVAVEPDAETTDGIFELNETDIIWLKHVVTAYDAIIDNTIRNAEPYWSDDSYYESATELWAENNIEGYNYNGTHELYNNPLPMGQDSLNWEIVERYGDEWYDNGFWASHTRYVPVEGSRTGINVRSELGHTLLAEGYDVLEVDFYCLTYNGNDMDWDTFDFKALPPADKVAYEKYVYTFLLTRKHGEERWHIAEEVLTEKTGGPRHEEE